MTIEELSRFDGREGRAAYVAVNHIVYDLTSSPRWKDGQHEGAHQAGCDLTEELKSAPHVKTVIEQFPIVGKIEKRGTKKKEASGISLLSIIIIAFVVLLMLATYMV